MVVRIRFGKGPKVAGKHRKNRQTGLAVAALAVAALLPPAAVALQVCARLLNRYGKRGDAADAAASAASGRP